MFKVVWICRFAPGIDTQSGRRGWKSSHATAEDGDDLKGYVRNFVVSGLGRDQRNSAPARFDGYSCEWFDEEAAYHRYNQQVLLKLGDDAGEQLFDMSHMVSMSAVIDEHVILEGKPGPVKLAWIMRFRKEARADLERAIAAHTRWIERHKALGAQVPGLGRYVHNRVVASLSIAGLPPEAPEFCSLSECWFADGGALQQAMTSTQWLALNRHTEALFDMAWTYDGHGASLEEHVIKAPPDHR